MDYKNGYKTASELLSMDWSVIDLPDMNLDLEATKEKYDVNGKDIRGLQLDLPDPGVFDYLHSFYNEEITNNHGKEICPNDILPSNPNLLSITWSKTKKQTQTLFRNASEMTKKKKICGNCNKNCSANTCPKCKKKNVCHKLDHSTHGGTCTLSFNFNVPKDYKNQYFKLIVSTAASEQAIKNNYHIHPTILHMSVKHKGKTICGTELKYPLDWKLTFSIRDGNVFYKHNYDWTNKSMNSPCTSSEHFVGTLEEISKNNDMVSVRFKTSSITVIKCKRDELEQVTEAKMREEGWNKCISCLINSEYQDQYKFFTGRTEERLELGIVRIKAVLQTIVNQNDEKIVQQSSVAVSEEIKDSKVHPNVDHVDKFIEMVRNCHIADGCMDNFKEKFSPIAMHLQNCERCKSINLTIQRRKRPRMTEYVPDSGEISPSPGIDYIDLSDIESDYSQDSGADCSFVTKNQYEETINDGVKEVKFHYHMYIYFL